MRRKEKLIQEAAEIDSILNSGEIIRLAMIDGEEPYLVPMSYGYKGGAIYLHCARDGRKVRALHSSRRVCFEVTCDTEIVKKAESCGWTYNFRSVIGSADVVFVEEPAEKLLGLSAIMEHYGSSDHSFSDAAVEKTLVIRLDIDEVSGKKSPA